MNTESQRLQILEHKPLGNDAFLIRLERPRWKWRAGELISLTGKNRVDQRDYTIASGEDDETLDVLYRLIPHGTLTPWLRSKQPGEHLEVQGPYGRFTLRDSSRPVVFCATGTGIAPCRAFLRSHPGLHLTVLHGVRYPADLYFKEEFGHARYHPVCSREPLNGSTGRVTDLLQSLEIPENAHVYLCGANEMIYEADEILARRGVPFDTIFHEPYYYRAAD